MAMVYLLELLEGETHYLPKHLNHRPPGLPETLVRIDEFSLLLIFKQFNFLYILKCFFSPHSSHVPFPLQSPII